MFHFYWIVFGKNIFLKWKTKLWKSQPNRIACSLLLAVGMISFFHEIKGLAAKSKGQAALYFVEFMAFFTQSNIWHLTIISTEHQTDR